MRILRKIIVEKLKSSILKECIQLHKEETDILDTFFEKELKDALEFVSKDMDENLFDSVDIKAKSEITKKKKIVSFRSHK